MIPTKVISVLVADAQTLVADGLRRSLNLFEDISAFPEHPSTGLATLDVVELYKPDVLVVEYWMPDMLAPAIIRGIRGKVPSCRVIVLSWLHGTREIANSMHSGASGFLPKSITVDQLAEAIRESVLGDGLIFEKELERLFAGLQERNEAGARIWERMKLLNRRELQVLTLLARSKSLTEIAQILSISPRTARNYLDSMLNKTGTQSQVELLGLARDCGLIS